MRISKGKALLLSAMIAAFAHPAGSAVAAEEASAPPAAQIQAQIQAQSQTQALSQTEAETRKPDVVLNPGSSNEVPREAAAAPEAAPPGDAAREETAAASDAEGDVAEPQVENEGDGVAAAKRRDDGENLDSMTREAQKPSEAEAQTPGAQDKLAGKDAESAAEEAAMSEAAKITEQEAEKPAAKVKEEPTLFINVDLSKQRMTVSEGGEVLYSWLISSGRYGYPTPTGTFNPVWMTKMWHSRQYDYAPMPHSIFFSGGAAIHATSYTRQLGAPASHGCVRLSPRNAETLFKLVSKHGKAKTQIVVHGTPNYQVAERRERRRYAYRYEYGEPSRYWREAPDWSYQRRYSTYYGTPPRYRRNYRSRGVFSQGNGYYGYGY